MGEKTYTRTLFKNMMQNEMLSVLQTYTSAMFHECSYFPRMDLIPMHILRSCDMKRGMQPCPTSLVKVE